MERDDGKIHSEDLEIVLGLLELYKIEELGREDFSVKQIVTHPNWDSSTPTSFAGDIAIIILTQNVRFTRQIRPICLPNYRVLDTFIGEVANWARFDKTKKFSIKPRRKVIQMIRNRVCFKKERDLAILKWEESFCAGAEDYSFCGGSSGVGFYVQKNGRFFLRGMVSSAAEDIECGKPNVVLMTDVLKYKDFLTENYIFSNFVDLKENCGKVKSVEGRISHGDSMSRGALPW